MLPTSDACLIVLLRTKGGQRFNGPDKVGNYSMTGK